MQSLRYIPGMPSEGLRFWKYSIVSYGILLTVSGIFLLGITSYVLIQNFGMNAFYEPIQTPIYFLYGPTLLIFLTAGIGWKAVKRRSVFMLKLVSVLQVIIICLETAGGIWNFISIQILHDSALPIFQEKFMELINNQDSSIWDTMQRKLKCCGIHGAFDYKTLNTVPFSCCEQSTTNNFPSFCASFYSVGCLDAFSGSLAKNFGILAAVAAIVALFQIPGVFATWCFANKIKKKRKKETRKGNANQLLKKNKLSKIPGSLMEETFA